MKRITVKCVHIEEGTKKALTETMNIYAEDSPEEIEKELQRVYKEFNETRKPWENKHFLQSYTVEKTVRFT